MISNLSRTTNERTNEQHKTNSFTDFLLNKHKQSKRWERRERSWRTNKCIKKPLWESLWLMSTISIKKGKFSAVVTRRKWHTRIQYSELNCWARCWCDKHQTNAREIHILTYLSVSLHFYRYVHTEEIIVNRFNRRLRFFIGIWFCAISWFFAIREIL